MRNQFFYVGFAALIAVVSLGVWFGIQTANAQTVTPSRHCFDQVFENGVLVFERCIESGTVTESGRNVTPVARAPSADETEQVNTVATAQACSTAIAAARIVVSTPARAEISALAERLSAVETILNVSGAC